MVLNAAEEAKQQAVERSIPVVEMRGNSGIGYYFMASDRASKPGELTYITKGILQMEQLAAFFTVLSNDGEGTISSAALQMLRRALYVLASER